LCDDSFFVIIFFDLSQKVRFVLLALKDSDGGRCGVSKKRDFDGFGWVLGKNSKKNVKLFQQKMKKRDFWAFFFDRKYLLFWWLKLRI
jgi:hypothetical protein